MLEIKHNQENSQITEAALVLPFNSVGIADIPLVGGKNASLGEMIQKLSSKGVKVPTGFATTAYAYRYFITAAGLEAKLRKIFAELDVEDLDNLRECGKKSQIINVRNSISATITTSDR